MTNEPGRTPSLCFFVLLLCLSGVTCAAQTSKVNLESLLTETQKGSAQVEKMALVWWIPPEYWEVALGQEKDISPTQISAFIKMLQPYTVFMVTDGRINDTGAITYRRESDIRGTIRLIDHQGNKYSPIPEAGIDSDTKSFLSMMKPILINMAGPLGQNLHFYLFPASNKDGLRIVDAKKEGSFSLNLGEETFKWKLPLGALLPPKICPVDGEVLSGNWKYCPWHGQPLKAKP